MFPAAENLHAPILLQRCRDLTDLTQMSAGD